LPAVFVLI
jgi:SP family arabinose:H+ symporter-like MFS transporter